MLKLGRRRRDTVKIFWEDLVFWMWVRRHLISTLADLLIVASMACMLAYGIDSELTAGQDANFSNLHDTIVSDTIKIQDSRDRITALENAQAKRDEAITALNQAQLLIHNEVEGLKANQETITHLLYAILFAILSKSILDLFKAQQQDVRASGIHRRNDDDDIDSDSAE